MGESYLNQRPYPELVILGATLIGLLDFSGMFYPFRDMPGVSTSRVRGESLLIISASLRE